MKGEDIELGRLASYAAESIEGCIEGEIKIRYYSEIESFSEGLHILSDLKLNSDAEDYIFRYTVWPDERDITSEEIYKRIRNLAERLEKIENLPIGEFESLMELCDSIEDGFEYWRFAYENYPGLVS